MLSELFINQIAVIERAAIDWENGFTVLTGETGAGKSIIIDAIHVILGERASKDLIRTGSKLASVSALFIDLPEKVMKIAESFGVPCDDNSLLIYREIKNEGKAHSKINGAPVTVSMLKEIGHFLVSIYGQHEGYELLSENVPINYIDYFSGIDILLEKYQNEYRNLRIIQKNLDMLDSDENEKNRQIDLLRYQIDEIESADMKIGEYDELSAERESIKNSEKILEAVNQSQSILIGDEERNGVLSEMSLAANEIENLTQWISEADTALQKIREAQDLTEEAYDIIRGFNIDFDPSTIDYIENRLDLLYKLQLKYGVDEEKVLEYLEKCRKKLYSIEFADEERERLFTEYEESKNKSIELAKQISLKRKEYAKKFEKQIKNELNFLNMSGFEFIVDVQRVPLYTLGCDKVQFLVSANKGELPKPMSKIASGGELSRIMLAIKTVLSDKGSVNTLIFDEVDTGISGEAANKVGLKLKQLSKNNQVICITHLAQMAAFADNHIFIDKNVKDGRTFTEVKNLTENERIDELARIIGGNEITDIKRKMAKEMLDKSNI